MGYFVFNLGLLGHYVLGENELNVGSLVCDLEKLKREEVESTTDYFCSLWGI